MKTYKIVLHRSLFGLLSILLAGVLLTPLHGCQDPNQSPGEITTEDLLGRGSVLTQSQQSPIDIRSDDLTFLNRLPALQFSYGSHVGLAVVNTGSPDEFASVRANVNADAGRLTVDGVTYRLLQFHWHTPGEHLIDGEETPMEMHLVHQSAEGVLMVVGVLIERGDRHRELDKVFRELPREEGDTLFVRNFNLAALIPGRGGEHNGRMRVASFRYPGSLTTPPFTEGVQWVVLKDRIKLSGRQMEAFMQLFPEGNSREAQPLNGREVQTDVRRHHSNAAMSDAAGISAGTLD
jgi:carbonic anhydrase